MEARGRHAEVELLREQGGTFEPIDGDPDPADDGSRSMSSDTGRAGGRVR